MSRHTELVLELPSSRLALSNIGNGIILDKGVISVMNQPVEFTGEAVWPLLDSNRATLISALGLFDFNYILEAVDFSFRNICQPVDIRYQDPETLDKESLEYLGYLDNKERMTEQLAKIKLTVKVVG